MKFIVFTDGYVIKLTTMRWSSVVLDFDDEILHRRLARFGAYDKGRRCWCWAESAFRNVGYQV